MFWRVFLLGETLVDVNTLNNQLPWGYSAGPSDYPYNRRDLTDTYVTREYFVVQAYRDHEFPFWNPYTMAGHPIYADGVTRTLSPSLLWYSIFDVPLGYSIARIVELLLAAIFMYLFLIAIVVSPRGSLLGAMAFELSAHSMLHLTGLGWWGGLMWLPLIILFADRAASAGSFRDAAWAGLFLAIQFFFGYLPNQIYYVGGLGLYYLLFWWLKKRTSQSTIRLSRLVLLATTSIVIGLALSATQWVPSLELLGYSNRKIVGAELGYVFLPPWYALTLMFPNLLGSAYDTRSLTLFTGLGVSHDHILYLGIPTLLMITFAVWSLRWERRPKVTSSESEVKQARVEGVSPNARHHITIFVVIAIISAVIMMTTPLYVGITRFIPVLKVIRVAVRAGVLFQFAACVLAAYGADLLLSSSSERLVRFYGIARKLVVCGVATVLLGLLVAVICRSTGFASNEAGRGKIAFLRKSASVLSTQFLSLDPWLILPLGLSAVSALIIWFFLTNRINSSVTFGIFILVLLVDLSLDARQFNQTFNRAYVFPATEITDFIKSLPPARVLITPSDLETNRRASSVDSADKIIAPPNTLLPYQISTVSGKNQQFPAWYREFASLIEPQTNLSHVVFDQAKSPYFDLLNVRYILTHDETELEGYRLLRRAEGVSVFENSNALPRAFFASTGVLASNPLDALSKLRTTGDIRTAVLEGYRQSEPNLSTGTATILRDKRDSALIKTQSDGDGLLVLSDNYYPGWHVTIDDTPVEVFRTNRTMRAVRVPAGEHMVSFEFKPGSFWLSTYISSIFATGLVAILVVDTVRRRRRRGGS